MTADLPEECPDCHEPSEYCDCPRCGACLEKLMDCECPETQGYAGGTHPPHNLSAVYLGPAWDRRQPKG